MAENDQKGLYGKYIITKVDGTTVSDRCFILKPDKDPAAVKALQAYAAATDNEYLRNDLYKWVGKPVQKPLTLKEVDALIKHTHDVPVWIEYKYYDTVRIIAAVLIIYGNDFMYKGLLLKRELYGKKWRCWTCFPSKEESTPFT